jgi:hypothetical protein
MVTKLIFLLQCMFFLGFFISKSFQKFPFPFFGKNCLKKFMQSIFSRKNEIRCIMVYARFLANFGSRFYKIDIFKMSKIEISDRI